MLALLALRAAIEEQVPAVGWGTLALLNAGLAQSKNRSGLAWFLVSLLIGPICTLLLVLLDSVKRKSAAS
ncbi:MAG TPA: hypothetical protein VNT79_12840 [Phycisphaerae bacterium]|nr:hypothetical protein [Phycisphaerae bacterium]